LSKDIDDQDPELSCHLSCMEYERDDTRKREMAMFMQEP
jgi:hypothetical protein